MMSAVVFAHVVTAATTAGGGAAQEMAWVQVVLVVWAVGMLIPIIGGAWYFLDAVYGLRDDEENGRPYSAVHYQEARHAIWTVLSSPAWPRTVNSFTITVPEGNIPRCDIPGCGRDAYAEASVRCDFPWGPGTVCAGFVGNLCRDHFDAGECVLGMRGTRAYAIQAGEHRA